MSHQTRLSTSKILNEKNKLRLVHLVSDIIIIQSSITIDQFVYSYSYFKI